MNMKYGVPLEMKNFYDPEPGSWTRFVDQRPDDGALIWAATYSETVSVPFRFRRGDWEGMMSDYPYTHWKLCVPPAQPKRPLPELPDGFVFDTRDGRMLIKSTIPRQPTLAVAYDHDGDLCVTLSPHSRHLAAQLVTAFDEAEKCQ